MEYFIKKKFIFFKFGQTYINFLFYRLQICAYFFSSFSGCRVFNNFVILHYTKIAKHIWEQCFHLAAETGSWFPLIKVQPILLALWNGRVYKNIV